MLTCWNLVETSGKQLQVINAVASLLDVLNTQMINAVEPVETASQRSHLTCRMRKLKKDSHLVEIALGNPGHDERHVCRLAPVRAREQ